MSLFLDFPEELPIGELRSDYAGFVRAFSALKFYVERDPAFPWLGAWLDHSRFRPALFDFGLDRDPEGYDQFAHWVALQAAREDGS